MKDYSCDRCGGNINATNGITDSQGCIKFKIAGDPNVWAGIHLELQSNTVNDICRDCLIKIFTIGEI